MPNNCTHLCYKSLKDMFVNQPVRFVLASLDRK